MNGLLSLIVVNILSQLLWANTVPNGTTTPNCTPALNAVAGATPETQWRGAITHPTDSGILLPTSATRETEIKDGVDTMLDIIKNETTPEMRFYEIPGMTKKDVTPDSSGIERVEVSGAAVKDGIMRGTLLLPVSAHTGIANATKWKNTDTYSLYIKDAAGKTTYLVKDAKSLDFLTLHDIAFPLQKDKMVSLYYHRSGSMGPSGFVEGRVIEFILKDEAPATKTTP